ncbi:unnamed protein product [Microthlaspi erraticum]|uniref:TTF-type domain-containing protein n=1 Tax=Microthlaspi erraticum TaxID=1685480 RepID=A0A6D2ICA7_9BRAS|nr:unnamed protein product [Microthlaspi erraticum]
MSPVKRIRIQPSGSANRKRRKRQDESVNSQRNDMLKYVTRTKRSETVGAEMNEEDEELPIEEDEELVTDNADAKSAEGFVGDDANGRTESTEFEDKDGEENEEVDGTKHFYENVDMDDPGNWGEIDQKMRDFLVEKGPPTRQPAGYPYPRDGIRCFTHSWYTRNEEVDGTKHFYENVDMDDPGNWGEIDQKMRDFLVEKGPPTRQPAGYPYPRDGIRCFTHSWYTRKMSNGEKQDRRWLVYSKSKDKIFCFCCKLFTQETNPPILVTTGYGDWRNASHRLNRHETTHPHMVCMSRWVELELRLTNKETIDKPLQEAINKERKHWRDVMLRIISVVKTLAERNLAFRGGKEKVEDLDSGNFGAFIRMIGGFDEVMKEHIRRFNNRKSRYHYFSHKIQNELIGLLADEIKMEILKKIEDAKYFSVILDSTPDISRKEQMTFLIRCVDISTDSPKVEEFFLSFLDIKDKTGEGMFNTLQDIDDVRGQGYDNGQNMKGRKKGVQKRLLDINPRAFYTPCGCHSLNLALSDMASSSKKALSFFGIVQRIYVLFAASTNNWEVYREKVNGITLKPLAPTRWESRIDSVKPIRFQAAKIREALFYLAQYSDNPGHRSEAESLAESETHGIGGFEFLFGMVIWYDLLHAVNIVSKTLQSEDMDLEVASIQLRGLVDFLKIYRETGFERAKAEAMQIAIDMEIEPTFSTKPKRLIQKKKHYGEESEDAEKVDESNSLNAEERFRIDYFINIVDQAIVSLGIRFEQFGEYEAIFGFLFGLKKLKSAKDDELMESCMKLEASLEKDGVSDVDGKHLFMELQFLRGTIPKEITRATEMLEFLKRMNGCYPNTWIAYRILLTIPISVACAERSFSKLKLIKNYLRSTMSQERLNGLSMISIEQDLAEKLDYSKLTDDFASKKARRVKFIKK